MIAMRPHGRARLRKFRIRGVKTNIPFLENVIAPSRSSAAAQATTTLIDTTPELLRLRAARDRATKLLNFLGDVVVNGNPHAKGYKPTQALRRAACRRSSRAVAAPMPQGTRNLLLELGPKNSPSGR
jgi:pyruvate carboxylase